VIEGIDIFYIPFPPFILAVLVEFGFLLGRHSHLSQLATPFCIRLLFTISPNRVQAITFAAS
jgi:hypothetical protein